jgi:serine/threonine-protein kinase RsbW
VGTNEAHLEIRSGPLVGAVLSRVVGMLAARALCPIDRLDDALLITDAIAAHAPDFTNGQVGVTVSADDDGITLLVSPLRANGAKGLLAAAELPGVGYVLERVADDVKADTSSEGAEQLTVRLAFNPA